MPSERHSSSSPFSRTTVLAVLVVGLAAFLAMLYFIGAGDFGDRENSARATASSDAIHGYSGLVQLLELESFGVSVVRSSEDATRDGLLVITPSSAADPEALARLLDERRFIGPTMVIMPKWLTSKSTDNVSEEDRARIENGWVRLTGVMPAVWASDLPQPYAFKHHVDDFEDSARREWTGLDRSAAAPSATLASATPTGEFGTLIEDAYGNVLAFELTSAHAAAPVIFVAEPDLVNNFGLADAGRAQLALALIERSAGPDGRVTFDLSAGMAAPSTNLLTLAFEPPFLASTICLILALIVIAWRAFFRFGPVVRGERPIAFGKAQLVENGAGLILRAGRWNLLAQPYAAMTRRRVARKLGLMGADAATIDRAVDHRAPGSEPFSHRSLELEQADTAKEIVSAAQSLRSLGRKATGQI
jgi:hypothetical protein